MSLPEPYFWGPAPIQADCAEAARHLMAVDPALARIIERVGPPTLSEPDPIAPAHYLQRAIVGQQLSGKAAATIYGRFIDLFGGRKPSPRQVLEIEPAKLRGAGLSGAKTAAIIDLAQHTRAGRIPSRAALYQLSADAIIERVTRVRGIGRWTAEMLLMFYLGHADTLPLGDLGIRNGYARVYRKRAAPSESSLDRYGRRWRPYRSVACWYLWRALELPPE